VKIVAVVVGVAAVGSDIHPLQDAVLARQVCRQHVPHVFHEVLAISSGPVGRQGAFGGQIVSLRVAWVGRTHLAVHIRGSLEAVLVQACGVSVGARCLIGLVAHVEFKVALMV